LAAEKERPPEYAAFPDQETAAAALENEEIGAYFVVPADYMASGMVQAFAPQPIPSGIEGQFLGYLKVNLLAHRSPAEVERLLTPAEISMATLDGRIDVDQKSGMVMIITPIVFAVLFVMAISMTSSLMMENVVEEKETRMVEMITTSITPLELLWGKIIGLAALGLFQIGVWILVGGAVLVLREDAAQALAGIHYPVWLLIAAVIYLFLGFILFGSLMSGIGASSSSMQEAQPIGGLFSMIAVLPLFFLQQFLVNSNGPLPTFLSFLPLTAPTAMVLRLAVGQVPWWQVAASLGLLAASVGLVIWLAAWVFRVGLLMTGQRLTPRGLMMAMRRTI
jgi:ABC-2 type transport system permease protein